MHYSSFKPLICTAMLSLMGMSAHSTQHTDTLTTRRGDRVILTYDLTITDSQVKFDAQKPRIPMSTNLAKDSKGKQDNIKAVIFDRRGDFRDAKWKGDDFKLTPFSVPAELDYEKNEDGFYILGTSLPITFSRKSTNITSIELPIYIAIYEKKNNYKLVDKVRAPLKIDVTNTKQPRQSATSGTKLVEVNTTLDVEEDNSDITSALASIDQIHRLLPLETAYPFSETLNQEKYALNSLKSRITDKATIEKINDVMMEIAEREHELKVAADQAAKDELQRQEALQQQQKEEEEARLQAQEEKERVQEEKQQKRTIWMIIIGVIVAAVMLIVNGVVKYFRDLKQQKNIMQMQSDLTNEALSDAKRRSREIAYNKAHQIKKDVKKKLREKAQAKKESKADTKGKTGKSSSTNTEIRSI